MDTSTSNKLCDPRLKRITSGASADPRLKNKDLDVPINIPNKSESQVIFKNLWIGLPKLQFLTLCRGVVVMAIAKIFKKNSLINKIYFY